MDDIFSQIFGQMFEVIEPEFQAVLRESQDKWLKKSNMAQLQKQKEQLEAQREKIKTQIDDLKNKISMKDQKISSYDARITPEIKALGIPSHDINESILNAYITAAKTKAGKNYAALKRLKQETWKMYSLAISAKEKRSIILRLQSYDWRQLGIDLPTANIFEGLSIEKGELKLPDMPALMVPGTTVNGDLA